MKTVFARLMPPRLFMLWLAVAFSVTFAFSIGGAAGLGFEAAAIENGPQENVEIALLIGAAVGFLGTAIVHRGPGAPVLMVLSMIFGLMGLREFETPIHNDLLAYLAGHESRIHWAILTLGLTGVVTARDRRWSLREHFRASGPAWVPLIGAAIIVVLGSLAEDVAKAPALPRHFHDVMEWLEETLEVCGYVVAFTTAVWMARIRHTPPRPEPAHEDDHQPDWEIDGRSGRGVRPRAL